MRRDMVLSAWESRTFASGHSISSGRSPLGSNTMPGSSLIDQLVNLYNVGGFGVGIGEHRPEKQRQLGSLQSPMIESERIIIEKELLKLEKRYGCAIVISRPRSSRQLERNLTASSPLPVEQRESGRGVSSNPGAATCPRGSIERLPDDSVVRTYTR